MSFTSTIERHTQQSHVSGTILLTPSRKRSAAPEVKDEIPRRPTTTEIWRWTFTRDAVAPCFIDDIFNMEESTGKEADFFWLGRVPCRTVQIVGLIVGVRVLEKGIQYSIDDGTAVIDCFRREPAPQGTAHSHPGYAPPQQVPPKPIGPVGTAVIVVGKVARRHDTREIKVNNIEKCSSSNDEPIHWQRVRALHKSSYSRPETFVIPTITASYTSSSKHVPGGSSHPIALTTPSDVSATPASSAASSPVKPAKPQSSPPKLRHPSRLSSRHLTDVTFQKYMMHYMHHTATDPPSINEDSDMETISYSLSKVPSTPTKLSRSRHLDETPRPGPSRSVHRTPRPREPPGRLTFTSDMQQPAGPRGFTLSHLRRVPELADMARRVVKAEAKRRAREERKKAKEATEPYARSKSIQIASQLEAKEKIGPRAKRLFQFAAVRLLREGSIVLWDGSVRPLPNPRSSANSMWKADSTSNSTLGADSTVFSSTSGTQPEELDEDDVNELSDPEQNEEAYHPLTPTFLSLHVEKAIGALANVPTVRVGQSRSGRGFTNEDILKCLRKDDRWRYAGSWHVDGALDYLKTEGRAWCVGKGKWELTV
ncbi:hypothetical protein BDZ94DRAFT_1269289 [Collybia nuda]|uniref:CST complex subunit STN1 n=1 Tax=Collybia nuda TaxID=64659 RepID=A0A9P5XXP2_9AGAR|nr:hypothetical protein BDZ94DRAFT_1269289 [Collybia nuda]